MDEMKKQIEEMMHKDYRTFVKALVSIETGKEDPVLLSEMVEKYMKSEDWMLIDPHFYYYKDPEMTWKEGWELDFED